MTQASPSIRPAPTSKFPVERARARILVVDDEPLLCSLFRRMLQREYDVTTTTDPREALQRVRAGERWSVILCDIVMPGLSGMELHKIIAREHPDLAARMIFLTGGAITRCTEEFLSAQDRRFLEKPLDTRTLRSKVAEVAGARALSIPCPAR